MRTVTSPVRVLDGLNWPVWCVHIDYCKLEDRPTLRVDLLEDIVSNPTRIRE